MIVIGECIHVISSKVKVAIEARDKTYIQELARLQVEKGANVIDLNIGPQKKAGTEIMPWMVDAIQEVVDVPLSLDTTNVAAMEAGLQRVKQQSIINSTDATVERLAAMVPLAAKYNANLIALTLAKEGLPSTADARIQLAVENILPAVMEAGISPDNIYFDPLVMTVNGNQDQTQETINAMRFFKQLTDPAPKTTCGLSNISNSAPAEIRPLINRVFLAMMMGAGLDSAIMDPLDVQLMETKRILDTRDDSTELGRLYLGVFDAYAEGGEFDVNTVSTSAPEIRDVVKTLNVLQNKSIYAHSYLRL